MKKFIVYLLVIVMVVSVGFAVFYLVRDNEVISISSASVYKDVGDRFTLDVNHHNKKSYTEISITSSDDEIVSGRFDEDNGQYNAVANKGGVARINVRTTNAKFRNLWCDVIVGDGTVESPFYISSAEQLAAIGMGAEKSDEPGVYMGAPGYEKYESDLCYKLVANIDVSTVNNGYWVPLQNFNGRLDGNGCTISNVYIDAVGYKEALGDNADIRFQSNKDAGLLASIGADGIVYNLKLENYMAVGTYAQFGTVTAVNYGKIERVEVKDAYLSIKTALFGGIAGANVSGERLVVEVDNEGIETASYERTIARIDRTSTNLILGQTTNVDPAGNTTYSVLGATGTIGGLVGLNRGGILVYSYARGEVYFGDDTASNITYGGIVAKNSALNGLHDTETDQYDSEFLGASVRDCYSDLTTILKQTPASNSLFGGAFGINEDYQNGTFEDPKNLLVHNYLIGNYYNKENLNKEQADITKEFVGIAQFTLDEKEVEFADKETIVYGLTAEEMTNPENFVSHSTVEIEFNDDGTSKGLVEKEILWLFESVWAIDSETNDGMPYLNYQLVYIPDDFGSVGVPIVADRLDDYYFEIKIDYPISILSGTDGKVRIKVNEFHQLVYSPTGIEIEWTTSDDTIVKVDNQGKLEGVKAGVASVTAKTTSGSQATVTVIVENIPYKIVAPSKVYLYEGETYSISNISITPEPIDDEKVYTIADSSVIAWADTQEQTITAKKPGTTTLTIKVADTTATIEFIVVEAPEVKLTASPNSVTGYINSMNKNGSITITQTTASSVALKYNTTFISGAGIVDLEFDENNASKLNYTIKGVGNAVVRVGIATAGYEDKGYVDINFTIKDKVNVSLTMSPDTVTGYYSSMNKSGSVTVSNSAGATLSYSADSNNENVVIVDNIVGNSINYTVKGVGSAVITVRVNTNDYVGTGYIYFSILNSQSVSESVKLNKSDITLYVGNSYTLSASGTFAKLDWYSSNPSAVSVDAGTVYANAVGTSTITAKSDYAEARCIVRVVNKVSATYSISISPSSLTLNTNSTYGLSASGNYSSVSWSSDNSSLVSVNSSGVLTTYGNTGTATITATAKDSSGNARAYDYCTVTVVSPTIITITPSTTIAYVGDTVTFTANTNNGSVVTWGYDNSKADFSTSGNVLTAVTKATGNLSVSATAGGSSANCTITINEQNSYSPYIYNLAQLKAVKNFPDKDYYLAANINVGAWTPFAFTGTFTSLATGNTYFCLSGISVSTSNAGLFSSVNGATIKNLIIKNSTFSGTNYAGAVAGSASSSSFNNCQVLSSTITSSGKYAGGIVGYMNSSSVITSCKSQSNSITASGSGGYAGGLVGYATSSSISSATLNGGTVQATGGSSSCAGGMAGYLYNTRAYSGLVTGSAVIKTTTGSTSFAGGIVGYTNGSGGSYTQAVSACTVASATITGYYSGGIGGDLHSSRTFTLKFSNKNKGYRSDDLESISYTTSVITTAVKTGVTVKGAYVGGLFGVITGGAVENCYTRATINGTSITAGFASSISASSGFNNYGGSGTCGIVRYSYSACSFGGSGKYAITASYVHNSDVSDKASRAAGYCLNYVFDKDKASGATYSAGSNIFSGDKVEAKKSSREMQSSGTYTNKGFSSSYWNISGYPTLRTERS